MKGLIAVVFGGLSALSAVAMLTRPGDPHPGKIPLVRTVDGNPRRSLEVDAFNRMHPDLGLRLDLSSNQLEKIIVQSSSGVGPDLFDVGGGTQLQTYVESGIALNVTRPAKKLGFALQNAVWPAVAGEVSEQGGQYSYPANVGSNILIYNKTVFDQLGVPYPTQNMTWDKFFALAKRVTRRAGVNTIYGASGVSWRLFFESLHGEFFSPDGTRLLLTQEPLRQSFQMHHDMLFKYRIAPTSLEMKAMSGQGGWGAGDLNQFADGRFGMISIGKWALVSLRPAYQDQVAKLKKWQQTTPRVAATRPAVMRLGSVMLPYYAGHAPCYGVGSRSVAVNALSPHRDRAVEFLQFLASKEYAELVNQGVDNLPGNPKYAYAGLEPGEPALSEMEMHNNMVKTMAHGYQPRRSPFLLTSDVERVLNDQISRIESDPDLPVSDALSQAQQELERLLQRNLDRDPKLKAKYRQLTGSEKVGAQPEGGAR